MGFSIKRFVRSVVEAPKKVVKAIQKDQRKVESNVSHFDETAQGRLKDKISDDSQSFSEKIKTQFTDPEAFAKSVLNQIGNNKERTKSLSRTVESQVNRQVKNRESGVSRVVDQQEEVTSKLPGGEKINSEIRKEQKARLADLHRSAERLQTEYHRDPETYGAAILILIGGIYYLAVAPASTAGGAGAVGADGVATAAGEGLSNAAIVTAEGQLVSTVASEVVVAETANLAAATATEKLIAAAGQTLINAVVGVGVNVAISKMQKANHQPVTEEEAVLFNNGLVRLQSDIENRRIKPQKTSGIVGSGPGTGILGEGKSNDVGKIALVGVAAFAGYKLWKMK